MSGRLLRKKIGIVLARISGCHYHPTQIWRPHCSSLGPWSLFRNCNYATNICSSILAGQSNTTKENLFVKAKKNRNFSWPGSNSNLYAFFTSFSLIEDLQFDIFFLVFLVMIWATWGSSFFSSSDWIPIARQLGQSYFNIGRLGTMWTCFNSLTFELHISLQWDQNNLRTSKNIHFPSLVFSKQQYWKGKKPICLWTFLW